MAPTEIPVRDLQTVFQPLFAYVEGHQSVLEPSQDVILVSIDLAAVSSNGQALDIGVSILDCRCLISFLQGQEKHDHPIVSTHHYCFAVRSRTQRRASKGFRFGKIQKMTRLDRAELHQIFISIFRYYTGVPTENKCCHSHTHSPVSIDAIFNSRARDDTHHTYRPIVLVGHSIGNDLCSLGKLGFNPRDIAPVIAVLDTELISYELHRRNFTLGHLCSYLAITKLKNFHISGNDAAYTLLALLKLVAGVFSTSGTERIQRFISAVLEPTRAPVRIKPDIPLDWVDNLSGPSVDCL